MPELYSKLESFSIPQREHKLTRTQFDKRAIQSIHKLEQHGFQAFIVGGAIRDLLCSIAPKDFDIVTNALPEQIHSLFKNSRIIGRRFKLVHLHFGRETLEVATFRAHHNAEEITSTPSRHSKSTQAGLLIRDNVYGNIQEDAQRRDFSINALYYSPTTECLYDFCGALNDIQEKRIQILGTASTRFQEDPVRMLRAHRFASKLGFQITEEITQAINENAALILNVSNARLFDESIKLFHCTHALNLIHQLQDTPLFHLLFPSFPVNQQQQMLDAALLNTQERILQGKPVTIAFIYAVLLWPEITRHFSMENIQPRDFPKLGVQALSLMRQQSQITLIPKRYAYAIKDIWEFQPRLQQRTPTKVQWMLQQKRFRAAFDFLSLRAQSGELTTTGLYQWWHEIQFANEEQKKRMLEQLPKPNKTRQKRRHYRKKNPHKQTQ